MWFPCHCYSHCFFTFYKRVNISWPDLSSGPNLSACSPAEVTVHTERDPGDQMAPNITCYFCTVAVDRTFGLQLSGSLVERLSFSSRAAAAEFTEKTKLLMHNKWRGSSPPPLHPQEPDTWCEPDAARHSPFNTADILTGHCRNGPGVPDHSNNGAVLSQCQ